MINDERVRVKYYDPTNNLLGNKEGTHSDSIKFPYEDYCMAVDLSIKKTHRYSCGWGLENNEVDEYNYSSSNATLELRNGGGQREPEDISFIGGTKISKDEKNKGHNAFLTTNYTDFSMTSPSENTNECLGIESINISYNSWMYPQVVIKFVDVRGGTVFSPAEEDYYGNVKRKNDGASRLYKSLFSFPYPMFTLKVKGFYGKGATYKLAVEKTEFEFDANTGNFNITVNFIGYMFGIYADLPLTYIAVAPFMSLGQDYWNQKINDGVFMFKGENGEDQCPMVTFPELRLKLAQVAQNQEVQEASARIEQTVGTLDERRLRVNEIFKAFPSKEMNRYINYLHTYDIHDKTPKVTRYYIFSSMYDMVRRIEQYAYFLTLVNDYRFDYGVGDTEFIRKDYDAQMNIVRFLHSQGSSYADTLYGSLHGNYETFTDNKEEYLGKHLYMTNYTFEFEEKSGVEYEAQANNDMLSHDERNYKSRPILPKRLDQAQQFAGMFGISGSQSDNTPPYNAIVNIINGKFDGIFDTYEYEEGKILTENRLQKFPCWGKNVAPFIVDGKSPVVFVDETRLMDYRLDSRKSDSYVWMLLVEEEVHAACEREIELINDTKNSDLEKYRVSEAAAIEKAIGFRPSIKNIYNLLFAHMETFMHCFFDHTKKIRDQLLEGESGNRAKKKYAIRNGETDTEDITPADGAVWKYRHFLPPYPSFYKTDNCNGEKREVLRWPEEIVNGHLLEEVSFIKDLLNATDVYYDESNAVNNMLNTFNSSGGNTSDFATLASVYKFIPVTPFDFAYSNRQKNPYSGVVEKIKKNDETFKIDLLLIFALRMFHYIAVNWDLKKNMAKIGCLEGINFFKALKDNFNVLFCTFIEDNVRDTNLYNIFMNMVWHNGAKNLNYLMFEKQTKTTTRTETYYTYGGTQYGGTYSIPQTKTITDEYEMLNYVFHNGLTFKDEDISTAEETKGYVLSSLNNGAITKDSFKAMSNLQYRMFPMYVESFNKLKQKYVDDKKLFHDYTMLPLPVNGVRDLTAYTEEDNDTYHFVIIEDGNYLNNIYKATIEELSNAIRAESVPYGNRKLNQYGGLANGYGTDAFDTLWNNFYYVTKEDGGIVYQTGTIVDGSGSWLYTHINSANDTAVIGQTYSEKKSNYCIAVPSMALQEVETIDVDGTDVEIRICHGPIFITEFYKRQTSMLARAYLFLMSVPFRSSMYSAFIKDKEEKKRYGCSASDVKIRVLADGAYFWHMDNTDAIILKENERRATATETYRRSDFNFKPIDDSNSKEKTLKYSGWNIGPYYQGSKKTVLKKRFMEWATDTTNGFAAFEKTLRNQSFYVNFTNRSHYSLYVNAWINQPGPKGDEFRRLQDFLMDLFLNTVCMVDLTWTQYLVDSGCTNFSVVSERLEEAFKGFRDQLIFMYGTAAKEALTDQSEYNRKIFEAKSKDPFQNNDVRLSTYMTLKSLYDKWLCAPRLGTSETWKLTHKTNSRSDFDNFIYIDSFYHDIGYRLNVNFNKVANWIGNCLPTSNNTDAEGIIAERGKTVFQFITKVAQDSGGMLLALPQKFGMTTQKDMEEMFKPHNIYSDWTDDSSTFIFMYTYKPSEHLGSIDSPDADMNGWSSTGDGLDISNEDLIGETFSDNGYSIPAFAVTYAKQNQSIFSNIRLSSQTNGITEAGLAATMNIASKAGEGPRESALYGQDLYRLFSQYSYKCSAEMMGNIQIMPLMYFQLNNVPLWKGAYTILKVNHSITPGKMMTTFEGMRINRYAVPLSQSATIVYKNKEVDEKLKLQNQTSQEVTTKTKEVNITAEGSTKREEYDVAGNIDLKPLDPLDIKDENNITEQKPLICLTPPHGPNTTKAIEWAWGCKVIEGVKKRFQQYPKVYCFHDGTPLMDNVHICNKDGNHTNGKGYSMRETYQLVEKFGSKKVISVVPHWNACAGNYFAALILNEELEAKLGRPTRQDSLALAQCFLENFNYIKEHADDYTTMPTGMVKGNLQVRKQEKGSTDGATQPNCACALLECWFWDYPDGSTYKTEDYDKLVDGKYACGRAWLENDGLKEIYEAIADGILTYVETLSGLTTTTETEELSGDE